MLSTKNWYFQIVLKKTLESLLVCKEIKPVNSKGNQPWIFHWKDWCWSSNTLFTWCKFSSVTQSCSSLCDPMDCSTPGFPVHHQLRELTQTHIPRVGEAIQLSYLLSSPSLPASNISQHQGLFQWVNSLHQVAKVLEFQLYHQSFQWIFRTDLL